MQVLARLADVLQKEKLNEPERFHAGSCTLWPRREAGGEDRVMTKRTMKRKPTVVRKNVDAAKQTVTAHPLAQALFLLWLNLKALAAVTDEDEVIAHPSGVSINLTAFHDDALTKISESGPSHLSASLKQLVECFHIVHARGGERVIVSALRAIRTRLDKTADHFESRPFTNDHRLMASLVCAEACDLCALAIQNFAVNNVTKIES